MQTNYFVIEYVYGLTDLFTRKTSFMTSLSSSTAFTRHYKISGIFMVALKREWEKSFVCLYNAIQVYTRCHILQCIKNFVSPNKCSVFIYSTDRRRLANWETVHHTLNIFFPDMVWLFWRKCDSIVTWGKGLSTVFTEKSLDSTFMAVLFNMNRITVWAKNSVLEFFLW